MTWIISSTVPGYVLPRLERVYDTLEELSRGAFCDKRLGALLSNVILIALSVSLAYVLTTWSAWCVLRYFIYTHGMETGRALYGVTGFIFCEYALGKMAKAHGYRGFFMSVFHYAFAMGAYVVFIMNPRPLVDAYPWLMEMMDFKF